MKVIIVGAVRVVCGAPAAVERNSPNPHSNAQNVRRLIRLAESKGSKS